MTVRYSMHNTIGLPYYSHPHAHSAQDCQGALSDGEIAAIVIVPFVFGVVAVIIVIALIVVLRKNNVICNDNYMSKDKTTRTQIHVPPDSRPEEPPAYDDIIETRLNSSDPQPPSPVELDADSKEHTEATNRLSITVTASQEQLSSGSSEQTANSKSPNESEELEDQNVNKDGGKETTDSDMDSSKGLQGTSDTKAN